MISAQFDYVAPETLEEAIAQLNQGEDTKVVAGGTNLVTDLKRRRLAPSKLVDLRKVTNLREISRASDNSLRIGAMTTCADIADNAEVLEDYPALAEAANGIGDQQVRNRRTIGGSLANNDPAADLPAVALAFEATITIAGPEGSREISADKFLGGPHQTALSPGEILTAVRFPARQPASASAYERFRNPASGNAVCGLAVMIEKSHDGTIGKCRAAVTGASAHATRLRRVEGALEGKEPSADNIAEAARQVTGEGLEYSSDLQASAEYRAHLTQVLTERAITRAIQSTC